MKKEGFAPLSYEHEDARKEKPYTIEIGETTLELKVPPQNVLLVLAAYKLASDLTEDDQPPSIILTGGCHFTNDLIAQALINEFGGKDRITTLEKEGSNSISTNLKLLGEINETKMTVVCQGFAQSRTEVHARYHLENATVISWETVLNSIDKENPLYPLLQEAIVLCVKYPIPKTRLLGERLILYPLSVINPKTGFTTLPAKVREYMREIFPSEIDKSGLA